MGCVQSSEPSPLDSVALSMPVSTTAKSPKCLRRERITEELVARERSVRGMEERLASPSIPSEGVGLLVKSASARAAFSHFLKHEYVNEAQPLSAMLARSHPELTSYPELATRADKLLAVYGSSEDDSTEMGSNNGSHMSSSPSLHHLSETPLKKRTRRLTTTNAVYKSQCHALIALAAFPWFALSASYEEWCRSELDKGSETPAHVKGEGDNVAAMLLHKLTQSFRVRDEAAESVDRVTESIADAGSGGGNAFLLSKSWLHALINIVEDLPVCVTIADAHKSQPGFPLLYVNQMFEEVSGYSRSEVKGKNCRFMQSGGYSEESQIARISDALRNAQPIKIKITNYRKDGSKFRNLLALKPVFDMEGNYCFVVGIQIDCSAEDSDVEQITLVDNLLYMIPNVMYTHN